MERHQTLWNTIAWSYELLSSCEQAIFDRLSVFAGGFTLDAVHGICSPDSDRPDVEDTLIALVERSLVVAERTPHELRYRLLETLRQFGEGRLAEDEIDSVRRRHADWYATFAEQAYAGLGTANGIDWNRRRRAEIDNLRTVVHGIDRDSATRVVASMGILWWCRLDYEYVDWALQVLERPGSDESRWSLALVQGLYAAQNAGRVDAAERECAGRFHRGRYLAAVNEPGARAEFERAAALSHEFDWPLVEHVALSELAGALASEGDLAAARPRLADAIRTWIKAGDLAQLWVTLHHVADFLTKDGDRQRARDVWSQLRDRPGFASRTQRSALQDRFGEPPSTTLSDDEMLVWSRDLAEHLAIS